MNQQPCEECKVLQQKVNEAIKSIDTCYIEVQIKLKCPKCGNFYPLNFINPKLKIEPEGTKIVVPRLVFKKKPN